MEQSLSEHVPHVFRLALRLCRDRLLAEDLTQDTMLKAIEKRDQLEEQDRLRVWLFRILANTWKDHVRRETIRRTEPLLSEPTAPVRQTEEHKDELQLALDAMNSLPEKQRAVLHLFAVEQLSLNEIGEVLGMKPATARVNLFHARQAMKRKLPQFSDPKRTTTKPLR